MIVTWEPSDANFVIVRIKPSLGTQTGWAEVYCATHDDGGLEIPAEAISLLALDEASLFKLRVERFNEAGHFINDADAHFGAAQLYDISVAEVLASR